MDFIATYVDRYVFMSITQLRHAFFFRNFGRPSVVRRTSDGREKFDTKVHIYDRGKFLKNYAPLMSIVDCFSSNMSWSGSFHDCYPFAPFAFFPFWPSSVGRPTDEIFKKLEKMLKFLEKMLKSCCQHMNIVLGQKNVIFFNGAHTMIIFYISPALEPTEAFSLFTSWHAIAFFKFVYLLRDLFSYDLALRLKKGEVC